MWMCLSSGSACRSLCPTLPCPTSVWPPSAQCFSLRGWARSTRPTAGYGPITSAFSWVCALKYESLLNIILLYFIQIMCVCVSCRCWAGSRGRCISSGSSRPPQLVTLSSCRSWLRSAVSWWPSLPSWSEPSEPPQVTSETHQLFLRSGDWRAADSRWLLSEFLWIHRDFINVVESQ